MIAVQYFAALGSGNAELAREIRGKDLPPRPTLGNRQIDGRRWAPHPNSVNSAYAEHMRDVRGYCRSLRQAIEGAADWLPSRQVRRARGRKIAKRAARRSVAALVLRRRFFRETY